MSVQPSLCMRFDKPPGWLDPRASIARASVGYRMAGDGYLALAPANVLRPHFDPQTGRCLGALIERQATNLLAPSGNFSLLWSLYNCTETANAGMAPTGSAVASLLTVTGAGAFAANAFTITAGQGIAFSVFVKTGKSPWAALSLTDGIDTITTWFNLYDGTVGSSTTPSGSTILFDQAYAEIYPNGWRRIVLCIRTASSTSWTAGLWPASLDGAAAVRRDSMYAWGMQAEADHVALAATSLITTAMTSATRAADNITIPSDTRWYNPNEGTLLFEWVQAPRAPWGSSSPAPVNLGGLGDTFTNTIYLLRGLGGGTNGSLYATFNSASGGSLLARTCAFTPGVTYRAAFAWALNDCALALDGTVTSSGSAFSLAGSPPRFTPGMSPFNPTNSTQVANCPMREFEYYPRRLSNALLQTITS